MTEPSPAPPAPHRPRVLVFDTETTGLPPSDPEEKCLYAPYKEWKNQCRLLQLAFQIYEVGELDDAPRDCLKAYNAYVLPEPGLTIPEASIAVHGISLEYIHSQGSNSKFIHEVISDLFEAIDTFQIDKLVAHNLAFDYHVIHYELYRLRQWSRLKQWPKSPTSSLDLPCGLRHEDFNRWTERWTQLPGYCTYRQGRRYLERTKHPWVSGRLTSYYSHFVEPWETSALKEEITLHHADGDVKVCWELFQRLYALTHSDSRTHS